MYSELIESKSCFFAFYFDKNKVKDTLLADWILEELEELVVLTQSVLLSVDFLDVFTGFYSYFAS